MFLLPSAGSSAEAKPKVLTRYQPQAQIRFATPAQAEAKRQELIRFIWADGLPTNALPAVATNIGSAVFSGDLGGLNRALASAVDRLDVTVAPYEFHALGYLAHPLKVSANNRRLVILNSGHRVDGPFAYGVNGMANRLLSEGFQVLMTDMPVVGFNSHKTITLPNNGGIVTIGQRGTAGHNEMFAKFTPTAVPDGAIFRFFLESMVQGVNYFLQVTPNAEDVSFVGLSGGGWTGHMLAAVDTRIRQSFPVAGAMPLYAREFSPGSIGDMEQTYPLLYGETDTDGDGITDTAAGLASWLEIFALGGYGPGRRQLQILNFYDDCCFSGDVYVTYTNFVSTVVRNLGQGEWNMYSDTTHKQHQISSHVREKVILPALLDRAGASQRDDKSEPSKATGSLSHDEKPKLVNAPDLIEPINAPFPMPQLKRPVFKDQTFRITEYGAKGDIKNTEAFRQAIAACSAAGGGTVLVPAGKWFTGAIHLKSDVNLRLEIGAEIHFSDDPNDYLPIVFTRWGGLELMNYSPLIYAHGCTNIAITGPGSFYGHGRKWWGWAEKGNLVTAPWVYQHQVLDYVPPQQRLHGTPTSALRPQFFNPVRCTNVLFEGFTVADGGPFWTFDITYCENIIVRGLNIHVTGPNNDGVNFDSSRNGLIEYCVINSQDDCVALKSGINEDGWRVGRPTENIVIRHMPLLSSASGGLPCGSDMSGGVRNIYVFDCYFTNCQKAVWIKSNASRGGVVENIWYENLRIRNVRDALAIEANYGAYMANQNGQAFPKFRAISYQGITVKGAARPADLDNPYHPIEGVTLANVTITGAKSNMRLSHIKGLTLKNVTCNGTSDRMIIVTNCTEVLKTR